jgi:hypothetical protein
VNTPTPEAVQHLIDAAEALLEARANQMVTAVAWATVARALADCGGQVPAGDPDSQ